MFAEVFWLILQPIHINDSERECHIASYHTLGKVSYYSIEVKGAIKQSYFPLTKNSPSY